MNPSPNGVLPLRAHDPEREDQPPWIWSQHWLDLLFLHWRLPVSALAPLVPAALEIETWAGTAWISLVIFRLRVRPRWLPFIPGLSNLVEVNLRTYVRRHDRPGIYFLNIWADNRWAIYLAAQLTALPYTLATVKYDRQGAAFQFHGQGLGSPSGDLSLAFQPTGAPRVAEGRALDTWLLERYRLYVDVSQGELYHTEVTHAPWVIRDVEMAQSAPGIAWRGLQLARPPDLTHYSAGVWSRFSGFRPCAAE